MISKKQILHKSFPRQNFSISTFPFHLNFLLNFFLLIFHHHRIKIRKINSSPKYFSLFSVFSVFLCNYFTSKNYPLKIIKTSPWRTEQNVYSLNGIINITENIYFFESELFPHKIRCCCYCCWLLLLWLYIYIYIFFIFVGSVVVAAFVGSLYIFSYIILYYFFCIFLFCSNSISFS